MSDPAQVLARESLALEPLPQNVGRARRTVIDALLSADRADLVDAAALVTSEVVTNAVLHAGSQIWLTVTVTGDGVLVEVEDHSAHVPSPRTYDAGATTGRGMLLVDSLTSDFGVRRIEGDGKVVWFTLGGRLSDAPDDAQPDDVHAPGIRLLGVPVALYCAMQQMADGLLREYVLVRINRQFGDGDLDEWNAAREAFGELAAAGVVAFAERDGGESHVDLTVDAGPNGAVRFALLRRLLDRAVAMSVEGLLLAPPSQPEIIALRNWCCEQVVRQVEGQRPTPWDGVARVDVPAAARIDWDATAVTESSALVLAADDANRLVAVSRAAAELLGWTPEELVGQRIVAIVPEHLREAHIAGFVRHLVTGERRIIGSPVRVDALHRDGSLVPVDLLIEILPTGSSRAIFTATMTPAG